MESELDIIYLPSHPLCRLIGHRPTIPNATGFCLRCGEWTPGKMTITRVILGPFEITARPRTPYEQLYERRFSSDNMQDSRP